ncbi:hypothetical protein [Roseomonas xinghualingensis]|uniref:hypothetical protein n=1 Tax=Roseomonas xinghualingensis TaxID=2986475 RepID=UPI0021F2138A|nr:hypothetical protein [Roseomonas sp. SXEYE001]MCV4209353.1 hypothetical protein [Roseomonas sp. SXEYE001]
MTRLAQRRAGASGFRRSASTQVVAAAPTFVMVGDEKVTNPQEMEFILLFRSLPDEHKPAAARYVRNVANGMDPRDAGVAFWVETGGSAEDGARVTDAVLAQCLGGAS